MQLQRIPIDELINHLNQVDLFNLIQCSKYFYSSFGKYLKRLKKWIDERCRVLYVSYNYFVMTNHIQYIYNFSYGSMDGDGIFILPMIVTAEKILERIIEENKIPIKNGDFIKGNSSDFSKPYYFCKYYMTGKVYSVCYDSLASRYYSVKFINISPFYWVDNLKYDQLIKVNAIEHENGVDIYSPIGLKYFMPRKIPYMYGNTIANFYKSFESSYIVFIEPYISD